MELYRILLQLSRLQSTDNKPPRYSTVLNGHLDPYRPLDTDGNPLGTDGNSMELHRILGSVKLAVDSDSYWGNAMIGMYHGKRKVVLHL